MYGKTTGLFVNDIPVIDLAGTKQNTEEEATIWAVQGAFFRLNYDYKGKYLLEVNGRYDGSSKYGEDDRWGFFPSALLVGDYLKKNSLILHVIYSKTSNFICRFIRQPGYYRQLRLFKFYGFCSAQLFIER